MRSSVLLLIAIGLCGLLIPGPGQAAIYKWVDAQGHVHFGDHKPARKARKVQIHNSVTPAQRQQAEKVRKTYKQLGQEYDQERAAKKAREKARARNRARLARHCRALAKEANVADQHPLVRFKQDGTPQYLTDKQTAAYRKRLHQLQTAHCANLSGSD